MQGVQTNSTNSSLLTSSIQAAERRRLLVVEDNLVNQRLMCKILGTQYEVFTANNGLECLHFMQTDKGQTIDLVLCDIEMRKIF